MTEEEIKKFIDNYLDNGGNKDDCAATIATLMRNDDTWEIFNRYFTKKEDEFYDASELRASMGATGNQDKKGKRIQFMSDTINKYWEAVEGINSETIESVLWNPQTKSFDVTMVDGQNKAENTEAEEVVVEEAVLEDEEVVVEENVSEANNDETLILENEPENPNELFEEPKNDNHPEIVNNFKDVCKDKEYQIRALKENQTDYPFYYCIFTRNAKITDEPLAKVTFKEDNRISLKSSQLGPFIATMNAAKKSGVKNITLDLKGSEQEKKEFAAKAFIAGSITGINIESVYTLEDLKEVNPEIKKLIKLEADKAKATEASQQYQESPDGTNKANLERAISAAFDTYVSLNHNKIPSLEQMNTFNCGIQAIKNEKVRQVAQSVLNRNNVRS